MIKINYKSDFKINESSETVAMEVPFVFSYYVFDSKKYVVSFDGHNYVNCERKEDGSLDVIFNKPEFGIGHLKVERKYAVDDKAFADGVFDVVTVDKTDVFITSGQTFENYVKTLVVPPYLKGDKGDPMTWDTMTETERGELVHDVAEAIDPEMVMTENEKSRQEAEQSRQTAEKQRSATFNTLKGEMQSAITAGNTAAGNAQKVVDNYDAKVAEQDGKLAELGSLLKEGDTDTDVLYIADSQGNIIAKFGKDGITTTDVKLKDQDGLVWWLEKLSESKLLTVDEADKLLSISSIMWSLYNDALYITDGQGNVIFQITDEGVVFKSKEKKTWMQGKVMMSLCDSLGTAGVWQETIAKNTGMEFDKKLNYNGDNNIAFSVGGSQTATHPNGGFDRAIRLVDYVNGGGKCDVLFLENINDMTWVNLNKSKEDVDAMVTTEQPFFCEQYKFIDTPATDYGSAGVYFYENLSSCLSGITPKKGTTIYIGYGRSGKKITITNGASNSGSFAITVGGKTYNISVDSGDTISDIIEKVLEIDYANPNYTDTEVNGENAVLFMPTDAEETASLTFDANGTGVAATITSVDSKSYRAESYNSLDTTSSAWLTSSNWGELWSHNLVQIMKGLIEYLSSNLPSTQLYWFIPTRFTGTTPTTKRADGSIDFDAYKANDMRYDMCVYIQKKVCEYYSIPVIDLHNEGGINIYNQLSYYNVNGGVHPPYSTYEYWGNKATKFIV